jgi:ABC-type oligopeptide transport system ATPase subunit
MTPLLEVQGVTKTYRTGGLFGRGIVEAVKGVDFTVAPNGPEVFTIIGESGSGKSTLARMILNGTKPTQGSIRFDGRDLATLAGRAAELAFMRAVQPVFQNPFEAFNPLRRIDRYLYLSARRFCGARNRADEEARADAALRKVGLSLAEVRGRYPHEMSGGQLQRVAIARALVPEPRLIVADEPVSMIDASLRMTIVNMFKALRDEFGVSIVYITHDLATAYYISDRLIIMEKGEVVESGPARLVLDAPTHPYSQRLLDAVLSVGDAWREDHPACPGH